MRTLWAVLVAALLLVSSCKDVESGTIVKKEYTPPWTQWVQTCTYQDAKGTCYAYTFNPVYWPATYEFKLRDDSEDKPVDQRDTGWVDVPPADYEKYSVGDKYGV